MYFNDSFENRVVKSTPQQPPRIASGMEYFNPDHRTDFEWMYRKEPAIAVETPISLLLLNAV